MLFQSLLYCSNSSSSLQFKTLKSHTKTLKICPCIFRSPLKPSSGGPVRGHTSLRYWIGMLIYICYKECRYVAVCQFILCVCVCVCVWVRIWSRLSFHDSLDIHPHTNTLYNKCKSTFQFSNLAKYGHGPPEDGFKGDRKHAEANFKCFRVRF